MKLSEQTNEFQKLGISVAAITYDAPADLKKFHDRNSIAFPIAHDPNSELIKRLGILNLGPQPGDGAYGIPYPGMFLLDKNGVVLSKFAEESYKDRPDYGHVLESAATLVP